MTSLARRRILQISVEVLAVIVVVSAAVIALARIVEGPWLSLLHYNGDSLVLVLVEQSLHRGEPLDWVFSSQVFLFPEGLLYAISSLFTDAPRLALTINAIVNLGVLYGLLRASAEVQRRRVDAPIWVAPLVATAATLMFVLFMVGEPFASPNRSGTATPFLFTTYYSGATMSTLALLVISIWAIDRKIGESPSRRRLALYAVAVISIGGLTAFANPLVLVFWTAPFLVTLVILVFLARMTWREFAVFGGIAVAAAAVGLGVRALVPNFFAAGVGKYLALSQVGETVRNLWYALQETLSTPAGVVKLVVITALVLIFAWRAIAALYAAARPALASRMVTSDVALAVFLTVSAVSLIVGHVLVGSNTTRYLQPLVVLPLVGFVALLQPALERVTIRRAGRIAVAAVAIATGIASIVAGAWASVPVIAASAANGAPLSACVQRFLDTSRASGVASFWVARPIQAYSDADGELVQVSPELGVYPWMNNLADYREHEFEYVIVDGGPDLPRDRVIDLLGQPAATIDCAPYTILDYRGTDGAQLLTDRIGDSLATFERSR